MQRRLIIVKKEKPIAQPKFGFHCRGLRALISFVGFLYLENISVEFGRNHAIGSKKIKRKYLK
jgi:hypothetical protein